MSQSAPNAPSVVVNAASSRQQVPLRDYLNARVAPFVKKAITESLGVEAEFPLQWLGECLIHQSILYEGNPDRTNVRERFIYKFEEPKHQEPEPEPEQPMPPPAPLESILVSQHDETQAHGEVAMNETTEPETAAEPTPAHTEAAPQTAVLQDGPTINGVQHEGDAKEQPPDGAGDGDTEMGGTV